MFTHPLFDPSFTALKVCGITRADDAEQLVDEGVSALGINFWENSKRYLPPSKAADFLPSLESKILRVGVFVNAAKEDVLYLLDKNIIDVAQFHGDESPEYCRKFSDAGHAIIRAIGVQNADSITNILDYQATGILLDAHAPGIYGGTGDTFDWNLAKQIIHAHPELPILLAGGINSLNAQHAKQTVNPAALDLASGSESSPGIKDFDKIRAIKKALSNVL